MNDDHKTHRQGMMNPQDAGAFTLVEMLTVLAVISILLVLGLPGWKGMNSTGLRRAAVTKVMGVLDQARGLAISEGKNSYVVFASPIQQLDQEKWGRACAVYVEDGNFNLVQRSPWIYLPKGVAFKVDPNNNSAAAAETSIMNRPAPTDGSAAPSFPVPSPNGGTSTVSIPLPYLKFDGTGMADEQDPTLSRILIFQGYLNTSGGEVYTKHAADAESILLDEVRINPATGRAKYITDVSENLATPKPTS